LGSYEDGYRVCTKDPGKKFLYGYDFGAGCVVLEDATKGKLLEIFVEETALSDAPNPRVPEWMGTLCPECGARSAVMETRKTLSGPRRRFLCDKGHRFTTIDHTLKRVDLAPLPNGRPIVEKEKKDEVTG
jgi:hypothetical protein